MDLKKYKKVQVTEKHEKKYLNAKRILKIWKEYPDFLYGLISKNDYDNKKGIEKKFNKIVNDYENCTWYICPECNGNKGISRDAGYGSFGEPCSDWIQCKYCKGKGKLSKVDLTQNLLKEQSKDKKEYLRLHKKLGMKD